MIAPRRLLAAAFILALTGSPALPQDAARLAEPPLRIEIKSFPIEAFDARDTAQRRFGALEFRGGLDLRSNYREFGGISALRMMPDGEHFIALSDKGRWLRGRIVYKDKVPVGIADAEMAPILGPDGKPLAGRGWYDTESIADDGGTLYVGIERVNRIVRFDYGKFGLLARGQPIAIPSGIGQLPNNKGLEAMQVVPKGMPLAGTLIAISERGLNDAGDLRAFLVGGPSPGEFAIKRTDDFDISDCAILPSVELLILERRFSWTTGIAIRLRRIALTDIVPGATVDGPPVLVADMGYQIDNMEGLGVHLGKQGEVVLTMISDDNFSMIQRTLLLQFTLVGD